MRNPTAAEMIRALKLKPHPEGGHYRETFRDSRQLEGRPASTAILFLLARGERSHWHRIDAVEIWHYYGGAPLKLEVVDGAKEEIFRLGADVQAGEVPLFLISLKAGGVGLNLTAADTVIHYDPWWNPAVEAQATDRAHRIGQDKAVFVYKLICAGTVEEKIQALQQRKADLAHAVLEGGSTQALRFDDSDVAELFAPF